MRRASGSLSRRREHASSPGKARLKRTSPRDRYPEIHTICIQTPHRHCMLSRHLSPHRWHVPPSTSQGVPARGRVAGQVFGNEVQDHTWSHKQAPSGYQHSNVWSDRQLALASVALAKVTGQAGFAEGQLIPASVARGFTLQPLVVQDANVLQAACGSSPYSHGNTDTCWHDVPSTGTVVGQRGGGNKQQASRPQPSSDESPIPLKRSEGPCASTMPPAASAKAPSAFVGCGPTCSALFWARQAKSNNVPSASASIAPTL